MNGLQSNPSRSSSFGPKLIIVELAPASPSVLAQLRPAEREVAASVTEGLSNADIARRRSGSPRTVANQLAAIFGTLRVQSRAELVRRLFSTDAGPDSEAAA